MESLQICYFHGEQHYKLQVLVLQTQTFYIKPSLVDTYYLSLFPKIALLSEQQMFFSDNYLFIIFNFGFLQLCTQFPELFVSQRTFITRSLHTVSLCIHVYYCGTCQGARRCFTFYWTSTRVVKSEYCVRRARVVASEDGCDLILTVPLNHDWRCASSSNILTDTTIIRRLITCNSNKS